MRTERTTTIEKRKNLVTEHKNVAAIITPPDVMKLILVTIPLYLLYEVSIRVIKWTNLRLENYFDLFISIHKDKKDLLQNIL